MTEATLLETAINTAVMWYSSFVKEATPYLGVVLVGVLFAASAFMLRYLDQFYHRLTRRKKYLSA